MSTILRVVIGSAVTAALCEQIVGSSSAFGLGVAGELVIERAAKAVPVKGEAKQAGEAIGVTSALPLEPQTTPDTGRKQGKTNAS